MPPRGQISARTRRGLRYGWAAAVAVLALPACGSAATEPSGDTRTAGVPASSASAAPSSPAPSSPAPSSPTSGGSASSPSASASPPVASGPVRATDLASGLESPWGLVSLKDGSTLVSERDTSRILQVRDGRATELTTLSAVQPGGEGGLLGLAITRDEKTVFAYFTAAEDNRIVSMTWDGNALGAPEPILTGIPKGSRHNGGRLVIGPDGHLYVGTGEIGEERLAQDKKSLAGKILRITLAGRPAPDNPFDNEVYSYGHRNVQGLAFDDQGRLWASEFGDQTWDELNLITKGANYGWPEAEGSSKTDGFVNPKMVWRTSEASPSGLAYWQGELWMATLQGHRVWQIPVTGTDVGEPRGHFTEQYGRLRSITVTRDGRSMLLTASNTDGRGQPSKTDDQLLRITR